MINSANNLLGCLPIKAAAVTESNEHFKGRSDRRGLLETFVIYGNNDFPRGTHIWIRNAERNLEEFPVIVDSDRLKQFKTFVLLPQTEVVLADFEEVDWE